MSFFTTCKAQDQKKVLGNGMGQAAFGEIDRSLIVYAVKLLGGGLGSANGNRSRFKSSERVQCSRNQLILRRYRWPFFRGMPPIEAIDVSNV